jgi:hypothetical protein
VRRGLFNSTEGNSERAEIDRQRQPMTSTAPATVLSAIGSNQLLSRRLSHDFIALLSFAEHLGNFEQWSEYFQTRFFDQLRAQAHAEGRRPDQKLCNSLQSPIPALRVVEKNLASAVALASKMRMPPP